MVKFETMQEKLGTVMRLWLTGSKKVKIAYFQLGRKAERSAYHSQLEAAHRQKLNLIKLFKQLNK